MNPQTLCHMDFMDYTENSSTDYTDYTDVIRSCDSQVWREL